MKRKWIVFGVSGLLVIGVASVFFVFGNDVVKVAGSFFNTPSSSKNKVNVENNPVVTSSGRNSESGSGGSGGGSGGGGSGSVGFVCNEWDQVQYSVRDFKSNVECLIYGVNGCEKVKMICSSNIYNLDNNIGDVFGMKYSLEYNGEVLDSEVVRKNLDPRSSAVFRSEMIVSGDYDASLFKCLTEMVDVAVKCVD